MEQMERIETIDGSMVLEAETYTVLSLCDDLSSAEDDIIYSDGSCCACPSYTSSPCLC